MSPSTFKRADVRRLRLASQLLHAPADATPASVVRWFGAMQAQNLEGALASIALRLPQRRLDDVRASLDRAEIVRTWPVRGTLHLVPTNDVNWMLELTRDRMQARARPVQERLGLELSDLARATDILAAALANGPDTRLGCLAALERNGFVTSGGRAYVVLAFAAMAGVVALGAMRNGDQLYVRLDDWGPPQRRLVRDAALAELVGRYLQGHGPAQRSDIAAWTGLSLRDIDIGLGALGDDIVSIEVDGRRLLLPAALEARAQSISVPDLLLLPGYDEWVLGYRDRDAIIDPAFLSALVPGGNGVFRGTVVHRGEIIGTWQPAPGTAMPAKPTPLVAFPRGVARKIEAAIAHWPR